MLTAKLGRWQQTVVTRRPHPHAAALNVLEAQAQFDGPEHQVCVRIAEQDGRIYLDIADEFWRVADNAQPCGPSSTHRVGTGSSVNQAPGRSQAATNFAMRPMTSASAKSGAWP